MPARPTTYPLSVDEVTAEWLTEALSINYPGTEVENVTLTDVELSNNAHIYLDIEYASQPDQGDLPGEMFMKAQVEPDSTRDVKWGAGEIAARFYRDLLPELQVTAPKCYFADFVVRRPSGLLLLEDMESRDVTFFRSTEPTSYQDVTGAIGRLAELHAHWWNDPKWNETHWIRPRMLNSPIVDRTTEKRLAEMLSGERGEDVPEEVLEPARIRAAYLKRADYLDDGPLCLLHGDSHVGNSYRDPSGTIGFYDWQRFSYGRWAQDISYFIASALPVSERRKHERELLEYYLDELANNGVHDPPAMEDAWVDHRRWMSFPLATWACTPTKHQPKDIIVTCCRRFGHAMADLETFEALGV